MSVQETTIETKHENIITWFRAENPCWGPELFYTTSVEMERATIVNNLEETRDYPPVSELYPLWFFATSQSKQSTLVTRRAIGVQHTEGTCNKDNGKWAVPRWTTTYFDQYVAITVGPVTTTPIYLDTPQWQTEMRLKIKENAVNLGENLLEYSETCNMFADLSKRIASVVKEIVMLKKSGYKGVPPQNSSFWRKHLSNRSFKEFIGSAPSRKELAEHWLMIQYGIRPLVSDVVKTAEKLNFAKSQLIHKRYAVKNSEKLDLVMYGPELLNGYVEKSVVAVAYVKFIPNPSDFVVGNLFENAWNGTRLSFVIDWFLNIGDTLSALDALRDVEWMKVIVTEKEEMKAVEFIDPEFPDYTFESSPSIQYSSHQRYVTSWLGYEYPRWEPSLSWTKVITALALFTVFRK